MIRPDPSLPPSRRAGRRRRDARARPAVADRLRWAGRL